MATSTLWAAKGALVDRLSARPGLVGVEVTWGVPAGDLPDEWILVGDVDPSEQAAAALGAQRREETYEIEVIVSLKTDQDQDARALALRARDLVAEIENELRADGSLGGVVRFAEIVSAGLLEPNDGHSREALVPLRIRCRARI